jgi:CRISPR system Cascade subunit CasE
MYLSRLTLIGRCRAVASALNDCYAMHRLVWTAFPDLPEDSNRAMLYRVEPSQSARALVVLVQSGRQPDWSWLEETGGLLRPAEFKPLPLGYISGQKLRFRLRANPTVRKRFPDLQGKSLRIGIYGDKEATAEDKLGAWLNRKFDHAGALACDYRVIDEGRICGWASQRGVCRRLEFHSVLFEGTLIVRQPQTLRDAVQEGIGSGKGFGFGLLSLAPAG